MDSLATMRKSILLLLPLLITACNGGGKLPDPSSKEYRNAVSAFYIGLGALQATDDNRAKQKLTQFTQLAPGEPAGWANLGVLALRQQEFDAAYENLEKARVIVPDNSRIEGMLGLVEAKRGKFTEAVAHLRKAVDLDRKNLKALYGLAQEIERQGGENSEAEAQNLIEKILQTQPDNLAAQLELTRLAAKRGVAETVRKTVARIGERAANWPPEINQQFTTLQTAAGGPNVRAAASQVAFLRNVLVRLPEYRQSLAAIKNPTEETGEPFERFLKLPAPKFEPAAADTALTFESQPIPGVPEGTWNWISAISLTGDGKPVTVVAGESGVQIVGGAKLGVRGVRFILPIDLNYDFKTDLVIGSEGGLQFFQQENPGSFTDVTAQTTLPAPIIKAVYPSARAIDIDLDGDLDIWLAEVAPVVLRNNGDGTFKPLRPFNITPDDASALSPGGKKIPAIQIEMVAADVDGDGDPDVAMLSQSDASPGWRLRVFTNDRLGQYRERSVPPELGPVRAINAADIDGDGLVDLIAVESSGKIWQLSDQDGGKGWSVKKLAESAERDHEGFILPSRRRLLIADMDNNGALDLIVQSTESSNKDSRAVNRPKLQIFLNQGQGRFAPLSPIKGTGELSAADLTGDGKLDLIGLINDSGDNTVEAARGRAVQLVNRSSKNYHWQVVRPRAAKATGDQRINSFGIGGEIEIRAGLLFQKQIIDTPLVHFGLGDQTQTDVARIIWPNGSIQGEFELGADQVVLAEQRLKGSCPSLFAWNGKSIEFIKDCAPWSPALGLHINAQTAAGIQQTEEWMKIRGDQLAPHDGFYDLRITAELWETYYIDHYSLIVVDHPAETEIFTDERFAIPPPELKVYATSKPRPFLRAVDDGGQDVTETVRALDDKYLDTFGRGSYQGVTRDHFVELELPADAPRDGQLWLVADGFVHPTDGTVNIAMSQPDKYTPPQGLSLEILDGKTDGKADGKRGWKVARPALGFPAGKKKTILIDLANLFGPDTPRRVRLRTNMELYWDKLAWATGASDEQIKTTRVNPQSAELRFRGFSVIKRVNDSSPELPDYNQLEFTGQKWRDLIGYYTRYGDICELLEKVDDRIVIVNAGDEMRLRFRALPEPPAGWTRDYVMVGNGWIKDGDYNSTFSKTVLPLPDAKMREYTRPPERLEDDPVYQRHTGDWQEFHTRYVTPERFIYALRPRQN